MFDLKQVFFIAVIEEVAHKSLISLFEVE